MSKGKTFTCRGHPAHVQHWMEPEQTNMAHQAQKGICKFKHANSFGSTMINMGAWLGTVLGTVLEECMTYNLDTPFTLICSIPARQDIKVPAQLLRVQKVHPGVQVSACHSSMHKYKLSLRWWTHPIRLVLWHSVDNQSCEWLHVIGTCHSSETFKERSIPTIPDNAESKPLLVVAHVVGWTERHN